MSKGGSCMAPGECWWWVAERSGLGACRQEQLMVFRSERNCTPLLYSQKTLLSKGGA